MSQAREKEELLDTHYRRDFISLDNQLLNGEMFLQVGKRKKNNNDHNHNNYYYSN